MATCDCGLRVGAIAPEALVLVVTRCTGATTPDLSTVTSATIEARIPSDGSVLVFTAVLSAQSATTVTLTYAFPSSPSPIPAGSDGVWVVRGVLTLPGGKVTTCPANLRVLDPYTV